MKGISTRDLDVEIRPIEKKKQAIDRKEKSSQQFRINKIGRHLAIWAENKDIIHTCSL
jgi:hypothetical protein